MKLKTLLSAPLEELDLGVRAWNILKRSGVHTVADFLAVTVEDANGWAAGGRELGLVAMMQISDIQDEILRCEVDF